MLDWLFGRKKQEPAPQKKAKPSAEQEAQDKWKYDFIVQFLSGPLWKTSLLDFIDYHCVVFDTQQQNKFEYTTIHNKFKELVASLFDGMMQEVGLDDEKLAQLLEKGFDSKHKKIFNQLLLADDFLKFKQLMVNRNKTLESEAVKALHESHSKVVQKKRQKKIITQQQLLRQSKLSQEQRLRKIQQQEEEQLRKAIQLSKIQSQEQNLFKKLQQKVAKSEIKEQIQKAPKIQIKQQHLKVPISETIVQKPKAQQPKYVPPPVQAPQPVQAKPKKNLPSLLQSLPPLKNQKKVQEPPVHQQKIQPKVQQVKQQVIEQKPEQQHVEVQSQEDRKKRLMQQRERIRRKKQQQRKKEMAEEQKKPVQTIVLQEDGIHDTNIAVVEDKKVSMTEIERRRQLMKKIKNRIVDDF